MRKFYFDRFFVGCLVITLMILGLSPLFIYIGVANCLSDPPDYAESVGSLSLFALGIFDVLIIYAYSFYFGSVGGIRVTYLTPFRFSRTDVRNLRFAYLSSSENKFDGRTRDSFQNKNCPVKDVFVSFAEDRIAGYSFQRHFTFEKKHRKEIRLSIGLSSSAAALLLPRFKGTMVVPDDVYDRYKSYFDSLGGDLGITLEIIPDIA